MKKDPQTKERRKYPRVAFEGELPARIVSQAAALVDLSPTGVLLEVSKPLAAHSINTMKIDLGPERQLVLTGRVVRNFVHRFEKDDAGVTVVKYRVAIAFLNLEENDQEALCAFIDQLQQHQMKETLTLEPVGEGEDRHPIKEDDYQGPERRSVERVGVPDELTGQVALFLDFQMLQLSAGGMMVKLAVPLSVGSLHLFNLTIGDQSMEVQGEILNCHPLPPDRQNQAYRMIIQFQGLKESEREQLEQFVEEMLAETSRGLSDALQELA